MTHFIRPAGQLTKEYRSPEILCGDVADSFPCATCGAGNGCAMRCRNPAQANADKEALERWRSSDAPLSKHGKAWLESLGVFPS